MPNLEFDLAALISELGAGAIYFGILWRMLQVTGARLVRVENTINNGLSHKVDHLHKQVQDLERDLNKPCPADEESPSEA